MECYECLTRLNETKIFLVLEIKEDLHVDTQIFIHSYIKIKLHLIKHIYRKCKNSIKLL